MIDKIVVSVVMTTYNVSKYLKKTIASVLNQTYENIELVIIDDGSTDGTIQILRSFTENTKVKVSFRSHTGNIGKNLNDCIRFSTGSIIAILGADDIWLPNKLEVQLKYLKHEKVVCSNGSVIDGNDKVIYDRVGNYSEDFYLDLGMLLQSNCILASSILGYKYILLECGLFDENVGHRSEDYVLWLNIAAKYKIRYINQLLIFYRVHGENLTIRSFDDRKELLFRNLDIISPYLTHKDRKIVESANLGLSILYVRLIKIYYLEGDISNCCYYCKLLTSSYREKASLRYLKYLIFLAYVNTLKFFERFINVERIVKKFKFVRI